MKWQYIVLIAFAIILGIGLNFLPEKNNQVQMDPSKLFLELEDQTRFITTDQVADLIVNQDPTLLLVDVRTPEEYNYFSLKGAINIPLDKILEKDNGQFFNRSELDIVFYSNDDISAEQAWMLMRREQYSNMRVLKGGLNQWASTILKPEPPANTAPQEAFDLYNFRKAASIYFAGGSVELEPASFNEPKKPGRKKTVTAKKPTTPKKEVIVAPKRPVVEEEEEEEEEGC